MCKDPLHPFLAALPKCEHHMHLEGSLSPALLFTLAARNDISLPSSTDDPAFESPDTLLGRYDHFTSLDDFLHYYFIGMSCLLQASDFELLAWEYFQRAHADGVVHAEVFFDPQAHTERGVPYDTVVTGFTRACRRAESELHMSTGLILCFLRHLPAAQAEQTFSVANARADFTTGTLLGIGLDSSELGFPAPLFRHVYGRAAQQGIRRTAHAGEEGGPEMIRAALTALDISRIDHGIRMVADEALMAHVAARQLLVTVCPLSNVRLKCVPSVADVPIRVFLQRGVRFSLNSDDPAYFGGYVLANFCAVQAAHGLGMEEWVQISRNAIEGSWCGEGRKGEIRGLLDQVVGEYRGVMESGGG
ncbi:adenine deaminase [Ptychographa xylographoides]|nr:adenine deaminase [Ptychographa xylographoides]